MRPTPVPSRFARRRRPRLRALALALWVVTGLCGVAATAGARPERIRAGHAYYSDDSQQAGGVRDLGDEKNYEEVYQAYRYYEAVYDDRGRVVIFRKHQRGELVREDRYRYEGDATVPVEHTIATEGGPPRPAPPESPD